MSDTPKTEAQKIVTPSLSPVQTKTLKINKRYTAIYEGKILFVDAENQEDANDQVQVKILEIENQKPQTKNQK